jgi:AraC-like DNA-binding protein
LLLFLVNVLLLRFHQSILENFLIVGIALSVLVFLQTYYLWRFPEIVKEEKVTTTVSETVPVDWIERLTIVMREQKPYKNPELSVSDLAEIMNIKAHVLSRGINDHFHRNFRDFVNGFRIEEFIALAEKKEFKHYTFLALAQEVGFNSKSTFNLAFKKVTDMSPREYFKNRSGEPEFT